MGNGVILIYIVRVETMKNLLGLIRSSKNAASLLQYNIYWIFYDGVDEPTSSQSDMSGWIKKQFRPAVDAINMRYHGSHNEIFFRLEDVSHPGILST